MPPPSPTSFILELRWRDQKGEESQQRNSLPPSSFLTLPTSSLPLRFRNETPSLLVPGTPYLPPSFRTPSLLPHFRHSLYPS
ncbi:hypothetical protein Pmani_020149 [Petrolisthes manimaculis]|uniref:Uncharacterized protein n=1 Tax=Petrolisthes manimaculis TaxID=1843537 RepID=A0AAE1U4W3_9EUCA|nr:hypothetical protein Pmani_020149 [Petrolisthes manimaculis]